MAKEKTKGEEFSAIGKQTTAHAYSAMDYYFDHLKKTVASAPSGGNRIRRKSESLLSYAKDVKDMFRIQMEFMRTQMEAFAKQANSLGDAYIKAASGQTNKPHP